MILTLKNIGFRLIMCLYFLSSVIACAQPITSNVADPNVLKVLASKELGTVSPNLMGFNIVYSYENDVAWKNGTGQVPQLMKALGTRQLRYPGGTVVTNFHWENPSGQGWSDQWSPDYDSSKNASPETFMNIDEYLDVVKEQKLEPLVGINMASGIKYNRVGDGIAEAVRLMKHCISKGVRVKYYYLDNEPYHPTANFVFTPEQYAEMINLYVPAMKEVDPDIKIIVNTHPRNDTYIGPLLRLAGKNIDLVDVHMYWKHGNATFENWKSVSRMTHQNMGPYKNQPGQWEEIFKTAGFPETKLVVLEWNVGPHGEKGIEPSEAEAALMVAEQFTQFIEGDLFMSTFWPLSRHSRTNRTMLEGTDNYKLNKMYNMFEQFTDVLGQQKVSSHSNQQNLVNLAVKSTDGKTVWIYLINKEQSNESLTIYLNITDFNAKSVKGIGFNSSDNQPGALVINELNVKSLGKGQYQLTIPRNSFAKLTLK